MSDLLYEQHKGFSSYSIDDGKEMEEESKELERRGYRQTFWEMGDWDEAPMHITAYRRVIEGSNPLFLVTVWDSAYGQRIYVQDDASLMDLRIKLASLVQLSSDSYLQDLRMMMKKLFHATHGHPYFGECMDCDPDSVKAYRARKRALDEQAKG